MRADGTTLRAASRAWRLAFALSLGAAPAALAQSGGSFAIAPAQVAAGGGTSNGGSFSLSGSIAANAGTAMTSGPFKLEPGFWPALADAAPPSGDDVFTDGFE